LETAASRGGVAAHPEVGTEVKGQSPRLLPAADENQVGSCNHQEGHIRITELVKRPKDLIEYVIVHEMAHLIAHTHSDHFIAILGEHYQTWREARAELNQLPLIEVWNEGLLLLIARQTVADRDPRAKPRTRRTDRPDGKIERRPMFRTRVFAGKAPPGTKH
jgi:hypothetical protein